MKITLNITFRNKKEGGGACIYYYNEALVKILTLLQFSFFQHIKKKIRAKKKKIQKKKETKKKQIF